MVKAQAGALRTLKQDPLASHHRVCQDLTRVSQVRLENLAVTGQKRSFLFLIVRPTSHLARGSDANALRRRADAAEPLRLLFAVRVGDNHRARIDREPPGIDLVLGDLFKKLLGVDHSTWTEEQLRVGSPLCARREVIVFLWLRFRINLMAGIWTADTHQEIVFRRDVADDVSFAFASKLTADQHID